VTAQEVQVRESLEEHQRELKLAVRELKEAVKASADPRDGIRERPWRWLAISFGVGLWLGWR
jgi:ElaB/YqjD/DUF883 family membrane-anchored ribosome-binding protein